jgi:hypothetical protein
MVDERHFATHPDENLLSAFAEHALAPKERQSVLEHLSTCTRCRDVVFVAQQASLETADQAKVTPPLPVTAGPRPLWWGSLGVAGVLAVLVIAVPIALYRHRGHAVQIGRQETEARLPMPAPEAAPSSDSLSAAQTAPAEPTIKPAVKRASSAAAMKGRAEIAGSVADPSGAAIPGAQVTVRGASSGDARTAVTNPQGRFDFASLPSGDYQVEVQASGFNMFSRAVTVQPSERASLNAKLDVGSASETVSVAAASGGAAAGFISGVAGGTATGVKIENRDAGSLPLNGRNVAPDAPTNPAPSTQSVTVSAQRAPLATAGATPSAMVMDSALPAATFPVKNGVVHRCIRTECVARILPLDARAVSAAASGPTVMALDSDGNVFLSSDQGEHWNQVKVQWLGKAVGLKIAPPVQAGMLMAQPNGALAARSSHGTVAGAEVPVPAPSGAPFELTNDKGQVWVSSDDGKTWTAK